MEADFPGKFPISLAGSVLDATRAVAEHWQNDEAPEIALISGASAWLRGLDLNQRPLGYEPNELPGCSTPRCQSIPYRTP